MQIEGLVLVSFAVGIGFEAFEVEHVEKDGMTVVKVKESYTLGMKSTEAKMEWVLSTNKLVKEFLQRDLLHEKRRRATENEGSPLASPRNSISRSPRSSLTSSMLWSPGTRFLSNAL